MARRCGRRVLLQPELCPRLTVLEAKAGRDSGGKPPVPKMHLVTPRNAVIRVADVRDLPVILASLAKDIAAIKAGR